VKVYVAAKWEERECAAGVMARLVRAGHTITYDWTGANAFTAVQAIRDIDGVQEADALVIIAERPLPYAGTYVEFGVAVARGIPVFLVGHGMDHCIFSLLPSVIQVESTRDVLDRLDRAAA